MIDLDIYRPETELFPDSACLYPYTFNAHPGNSGERLQTLANMAGFAIYAADFMGQVTGKIYGLPAREALAPTKFYETCERHAYSLLDSEFVRNHSVRIGMGDSLGVTTITGTYGAAQDMPKIFSALLLRDGFNLRRGQTRPALAYTTYLGYLLGDLAQSRRTNSTETIPLAPISAKSDIESHSTRPLAFFNTLRNMRDLGPLMQGNLSIQGTRQAAKNPSLPLHVVGLEHGLSGSRSRVDHFFRSLHESRRKAADQARQSDPLFKPAELVSQTNSGWHADLMDPSLGAYHLKLTRHLVDI